MRNLILITVVSLSVLACSGGGGGADSPQVVDPLYGQWYYASPSSTTSQARGIIANIDASGVQYMNVYAYTNGASTVAYVRKSIGTYQRNGTSFQVKYSYETCNPVNSETLIMETIGKDQLSVKTADGSLQLVLARVTNDSTIKNLALVEDKNCNILSKIESKDKRAIASEKSKSFFSRILK